MPRSAADASGGPGAPGAGAGAGPGAGAALLQKVASAPAFNDWTLKWDAAASGAAAPRWSIGTGSLATKRKPRQPTPSTDLRTFRFRDTFHDKIQQNVEWVPGPGTHRTVRWPECAPPRRLGGEFD